jgi:hypothetical protein
MIKAWFTNPTVLIDAGKIAVLRFADVASARS